MSKQECMSLSVRKHGMKPWSGSLQPKGFAALAQNTIDMPAERTFLVYVFSSISDSARV